MRQRAFLILGAGMALVAASACGSDVAVFGTTGQTGGAGGLGDGGDGLTGGEGGETTSSGGTAGQGGVGGCTDDDDCIVDDGCLEGICNTDTNTCETTQAPPGTPCGGGMTCDDMGNCIPAKPPGDPCTMDTECSTGICTDGVCCDSACEGTCEACDLPGLEGTCAPHPAGTDPESECGSGSCDGAGTCAIGAVDWGKRYGDADDQWGYEVTTDSAGNAIITGRHDSSINFGGGALLSSSIHDLFVAKINPGGQEVWSLGFGGTSSQFGWDVVTDASDNVIVGGYFYGSIDFGAGQHVATSERDTVIAKLSPTGSAIWSHQLSGTGEELAHTVAAGPSGEIAVAGYYTGTITVAPGVTYTSSGNLDIFVAVYDASGNHLWSQSVGDGSSQRAYDATFDSAGNLVLTGWFAGSVNFGDGPMTSAGDTDAFAVKYDPLGNVVFSDQYGDGSFQLIRGVDTTPQDGIWVTGYNDGTVDLGGGPMTATAGFDVFVAHFDATGAHLFSKSFGAAGDQATRDLELDGQGNLVFTGHSDGAPDFGDGPMTTAGASDAYVVKLAPDGSHLWSHVFGGTDTQVGHGVAIAPAGHLYVTGYLEDFIDFGQGQLPSAGQEDVFLAKLGY